MHMKVGMEVLTEAEIEKILDSAFRIMRTTGLTVENKEILARLGEFG